MDDPLDRLADAILDGKETVVLTGAGVSTASGIPDFRGEGGIWGREFDPASFHRRRFDRDPEGFWDDRLRLHERLFPEEVAPNAAHEALATLESNGHLDAVITQNTDGLHAAAGSGTVIELHGNAARVVCESCGDRSSADEAFECVRAGGSPPTCPCGGVHKPDVVLFGESLPREAIERARGYATDCDVFLAIGSSLTVEPAASLPRIASRNGAFCAVVNLERTPMSGRADLDLRADVTEVLPALSAGLR
ncbi:NAD-dependent deacylase [Natronorarus salvus]|uniref:NAD-dependent deacylase n=1 Tax=Natronorarus salvus TaxID=3117733 RepID=UPI002F25EF48